MGWQPPSGDDRALGLVSLAIYPHLDHPDLTGNTMAIAEEWAGTLECPACAFDDAVDVVSEVTWWRFPRADRDPVTTADHSEPR